MIRNKHGLRQLCFDCEKRIEDRARKEDKASETINYLASLVLAWKKEAVIRGYNSPVRLTWEDSTGKYVDKVELPDRWRLLQIENDLLKKEIKILKIVKE